METIAAATQQAVQELYEHDVLVVLTRPDEQFGDYATNVALQLAGKVGKPPREIAQAIAAKLKESGVVQEVSVAGPGFINVRLSDAAILGGAASAATAKPTTYQGKTVVAEYSDPNPFKVLHAGHLYTSTVGDAMANLIVAAGGNVHRVNFGGDVGRHVAITMRAILLTLGGEHPEKLQEVPATEHAEWLTARYVEGTAAFEEDETAKAEVLALNKRIYQLHTDDDHDSPLAQIYWTTRQWSYDYFDQFYTRIGTKFEKYYPESQTAPLGLKTVHEQLAKGVYKKSDGAVVFDGEAYGLHTRVFINSEGLPTYEAKDVGLIMAKWNDYHFDTSVIITGNDIIEYMKVVLKSIEQFEPELARRSRHITHGIVKLQGGVKMSSRRGNILRAEDILQAAHEAAKASETASADEQAVLGAVKYAFLKSRPGPDVIYNPTESVSLQGNSGPYLQYAHARARTILAKAGNAEAAATNDLEVDERSLARKIGEYPEVVALAVTELMPHHIATYLHELAQTFNRFYEHNRVLDDPRQATRLQLVGHYADVLKDGLALLGIAAPDKM